MQQQGEKLHVEYIDFPSEDPDNKSPMHGDPYKT